MEENKIPETIEDFMDEVCQEYKSCKYSDYAKHKSKTDYYDAEKLKIQLVATERFYKHLLSKPSVIQETKSPDPIGVAVVKMKLKEAWSELMISEGEVSSVYHYGNCFIISFTNGNKYRQELPAIVHSSNLIQ